MSLLVPNCVSDAINAAIDKELAGRPCAPAERELIFNQLLQHFDQHGVIPNFHLKAK